MICPEPARPDQHTGRIGGPPRARWVSDVEPVSHHAADGVDRDRLGA